MWNEYLKVLDTAAERHLTLVQEIRDASKDQLNIPIDYYVNAVVSRSLHMLNGFRCLVQIKNAPACLPFLRFAIDTDARFHALWMVNDPVKFVIEVLRGLGSTSFACLRTLTSK